VYGSALMINTAKLIKKKATKVEIVTILVFLRISIILLFFLKLRIVITLSIPMQQMSHELDCKIK
jgi:hypothetical protein